MRRILLLVFLFVFIYIGNVNASSVSINPIENDGKYVLNITIDNNEISYEDAVSKYGLDNYLMIFINGKNRYFLNGIEIEEKDYLIGNSNQQADEIASSYKEYGYRVHNEEEIMKAIANIYNSTKYGVYHLVFSSFEKAEIDFEYIDSEYLKIYSTDIKKNIYNYDEYATNHPIRFSPIVEGNEMIINHNYVKTHEEEEKKVTEFLKYFFKEFENKSDYEKILGIYTYIKNTAKYKEDEGYENYLNGALSAYDVLINKEMVCKGASTTFQLLAEKLSIKSYIVDHVYKFDEKEKIYNTNHTYNIVQLDNKWYVLDISKTNDLEGFLIGNGSNKYDSKDFEYYNIKIENEDYLKNHNEESTKVIFDYEKYNKIVNEIKSKQNIESTPKKNNVENDKIVFDKELISYLVLFSILIVIVIIIYIFTRK